METFRMAEYVPSLILLAVLISGSAFFSGSETALFSLSKPQLAHLRDNGSRTARAVLELLARPRLLLVTLLTGNELINVGIGVVVASLVGRIMEELHLPTAWVSLAATLVAFPVLIVFGEVTPKTLAAVRNDRWALAASLPLTMFAKIITPVRLLLQGISNGVVRLVKGKDAILAHDDQPVSEEFYRRLVDEGQKEGVLEKTEREMIHNVFKFADIKVSDIMTPADQVFTIPVTMSLAEARKAVAESIYSRVPVVAGRPPRPVGLLYAKDLVTSGAGLGHKPMGRAKRLRSMLRSPLWVPPRMVASQLLSEFRESRTHMAFVVDEHGRFIGVVTMEDLLEELVGDILDETDVEGGE